MTLMMMHINDPVPNVRSLNPDVPEALVAIINKSLAKDPNQRFQTAAQMAAALRNALGRVSAAGTGPAPAATMMDESPVTAANLKGATAYEPQIQNKGTYVEQGPMPQARGTYVESAPQQRPGTGMYSATGSSAVQQAPPQARRSGLALPLIIGGLVGGLCLLVGAGYIVSRLIATGGEGNPPTEPVAVVINTEVPIATTEAAVEVIPTDTVVPATPTPSGPYVVINSIALENNIYVVDYSVFNEPPNANLHVHMFFDTVPPDQAGSPGSGPWKLTHGAYGPSPFTQYGVSNRPGGATQMCALIANPNHSVQLNSGNCFLLP